MSIDLKQNKKALIIGASSGIGKACAHLMADSENTLYLVARNEDALKEMQEYLPGTVYAIPHDLNDVDGIKRIFDEIKEHKVKLNSFVYTAGMDAFSPVKVTSVESLRKVMDINCFAFCETAKRFFNRQISEDGAGIVAISSIASLLCEKGQMAYTASKSALNSVVKTMAQEFSSRRIRVNAILPAGVSTPMAASKSQIMEGVASNTVEKEVQKVNRQFLGEIPAEIVAQNILFLLSEYSAYTTGELLTMGAGYSY